MSSTAIFVPASDRIEAEADVRQRQECQGEDPQQGPRRRLMTQTQHASAVAAIAAAAAAAVAAVVVVVTVLASGVAISPRFSLPLLTQPAGLSPHWSLPEKQASPIVFELATINEK